MGAQKLVFDLVPENTTVPNPILPPVKMKSKRDSLSDLVDWFVGWLSGQSGSGESSYAQIETVGGLGSFDYNPRNTESTEPNIGFFTFGLNNATFANGTNIPDGRYRILMRALKIAGDIEEESDYEAWLSPVMVFNTTST